MLPKRDFLAPCFKSLRGVKIILEQKHVKTERYQMIIANYCCCVAYSLNKIGVISIITPENTKRSSAPKRRVQFSLFLKLHQNFHQTKCHYEQIDKASKKRLAPRPIPGCDDTRQ